MSTPNDSSKLTAGFDSELPDWHFFPLHWLANHLRVTTKHVDTLIATGEIKMALDLRGKASSRATIRIPRKAIVDFLNARRDVEAVAAANPRPKYRSERAKR